MWNLILPTGTYWKKFSALLVDNREHSLHRGQDRNAYKVKDLPTAAEELGIDAEELQRLEEEMKGKAAEADSGWLRETMTSNLALTRTDSGALSIPIGSKFYFGEIKSALDQETALTADEIMIDRMLNELNRLVNSHNTPL